MRHIGLLLISAAAPLAGDACPGCDRFGGLRVHALTESDAALSQSCVGEALRDRFGGSSVSMRGDAFHVQLPLKERPDRTAAMYATAKPREASRLAVEWSWDGREPTVPGFRDQISMEIGATLQHVMARCAPGVRYNVRCEPTDYQTYPIPCPRPKSASFVRLPRTRATK
jgi:hypothetical protein